MFYLGYAVGMTVTFLIIMFFAIKGTKGSEKRNKKSMEYLEKRNALLHEQNGILNNQNQFICKIWQRLPKLEEDEV